VAYSGVKFSGEVLSGKGRHGGDGNPATEQSKTLTQLVFGIVPLDNTVPGQEGLAFLCQADRACVD